MKKLLLILALGLFYSNQIKAQFAGGSGTTEDPYLISTIEQLQLIRESIELYFDDHFEQINDINAGITRNWDEGKGFLPIGNSFTEFTGSYNGNGFSIDSLYINRSGNRWIGLFGRIENAEITNINLTNVWVYAWQDVGGLVGYAEGSQGKIENVSVQGYVYGTVKVGGVVGYLDRTTLTEASADMDMFIDAGGGHSVGGLVGIVLQSTKVERSFSQGSVNAASLSNVGGLIGDNNGTINDSYSTATVTGSGNVGGLIGNNQNNGNITRAYTASIVNGSVDAGSIVGNNNGSFTNTFYDAEKADGLFSVGIGSNGGLVGLDTEAMIGDSASTTMSVFDFENIWVTRKQDYPALAWSFQFFELDVDAPVTVLLEGDTFQVDVQVTNSGGRSGSQKITLTQQNETELASFVTDTLTVGASQNFTLDWLTGEGDAGVYTLKVKSEQDSVLIGVEVLEKPAIPVLVDPSDQAIHVEVYPIFTWQEAALAEFYEIQLATSSDFENDVFFEETSIDTSYELSVDTLSYFSEYYWRVRSRIAEGEGEWSETWSFTTKIAPPTLVSPENSETEVELNVLFTWQPVEGADDYELQVATDMLFTELVDVSAKTNQASSKQKEWIIAQQVAGLELDSEYYWRTRSIRNGNLSDWSESQMFATISTVEPAIQLITPTEGSVEIDLTPDFYWSSNTEDAFLLTYSQDSLFTNSTSIEVDSMGFTPVESLEDNARYFWEVSKLDGDEIVVTSERVSFWTNTALEPPLEFELLSPANETSFVEVSELFTWSKALDNDPLDVASYRVLVSKDENFEDEVLFYETGTDTSITIGEELDSDSKYYWKVEAIDTDSLVTTSQVFSFNSVVLSSAEGEDQPLVFELNQNYPNPFNPNTVISYSLPQSGNVKLTVINSAGKQVATLVDGIKNQGSHTVSFDASSLASGIYFYRIEAGSFTKTMKMTLIK